MRKTCADVSVLALVLVVCGVVADRACGQHSVQKIVENAASGTSVNNAFGRVVAISGGRAVVGAPFKSSPQAEGEVFVFEEASGVWGPSVVIEGAGAQKGSRFGWAVAISGDVIVVGAHQTNAPVVGGPGSIPDSGMAYVFERMPTSGKWCRTQDLRADDAAAGDEFGWSVAVSNGVVAVAANLDDNDNGINAGAVYVFEVSAGSWVQAEKIIAANSVGVGGGEKFGESVSLSGDVLAVGSRRDKTGPSSNSGLVRILDRQLNGSWSEGAVLLASDGAPDGFGQSVSVSGEVLVVGADGDDSKFIDSGAAYIFERGMSGAWLEQAKLYANSAAAGDRFGGSVAVSGDRVVVGAHMHSSLDKPFSGGAYAYRRQLGGAWSQSFELVSVDGGLGDWFGRAVSVSGSRIFVGAPHDDDGGSNAGSAYVFEECGSVELYGHGCPVVDGVAPTLHVLEVGSCPVTAGDTVFMYMSNLPLVSGEAMFLFLGTQRANVSMGGGCVLNVVPLVGPLAGIPNPVNLFVPASAALATVTIQAFFSDPTAPLGFAATNGVEIMIQ